MRSGRAALAVMAMLAATAARAEEIGVHIPTRPDVTVDVLYDAPPDIKAVALLFAGSEGFLGIKGEGPGAKAAHAGNFLIRSRALFVAAGIATVALDTPSDEEGGIDEGFRVGTDHARDVAAVVAWVRTRTPAPIWLVGTSMGSISAAAIGLKLGHAVDGVVLTSSVTLQGKHDAPGGVAGLPLEDLALPVLVMDHVNEACHAVGPPEQLVARLKSSPRTALRMIEGGTADIGANSCGPMSYHGYVGAEDKAVAAIAAFVLAK